jgi:AcrR family transcriptional regulator
MDRSLAKEAPAAVRSGRPKREFAGEVEERILGAAAKVFLERGFEGASIDEIAEKARAGKPTIYARFPGKEALFAAVMARNLRKNIAALEGLAATGSTTEERLSALATGILEKALAFESVGLMRSAVAEARRFPDLAGSVHKMARERGNEAIAQLLSEFAKSDDMSALPAFAPDRLPTTARRFKELILLPILMRALFGEDLAEVRAEIGPHVAQAVMFFLAACRYERATSELRA